MIRTANKLSLAAGSINGWVQDPPQRIASQGACGASRESVKYDYVRLDIESHEGALHGASMNGKHLFVADDGHRKLEKTQIEPV
jgi:hypothetical protein